MAELARRYRIADYGFDPLDVTEVDVFLKHTWMDIFGTRWTRVKNNLYEEIAALVRWCPVLEITIEIEGVINAQDLGRVFTSLLGHKTIGYPPDANHPYTRVIFNRRQKEKEQTVRILEKLSPVRRFSIVIPEPWGGNSVTAAAVSALDTLFLQHGCFFVGSITELEELAQRDGVTLRRGIEEMANQELLIIEGDTYRPTEKYMKRFMSPSRTIPDNE